MGEILLSDIRSDGQLPWSYTKQKDTEFDKFQNNIRNLMDGRAGYSLLTARILLRMCVWLSWVRKQVDFGIRGIRIYQDGLHLADGTSQLDEISIFDVESVDIGRIGAGCRLGNAGSGALSLMLNSFLMEYKY
ncbi:MAG: hypothetical protein IPJ13_05025 [Saprospiraceae bacterium]|nr:hypothetical protein [Saprospiraceae bacterium]